MTNKVSEAMSQLGSSLKSVAKMALQSRRRRGNAHAEGSRLIIMGNGPSLSQTIAEHGDALSQGPAMAVNFAAIAPEFEQLRPRHYILVDPHFFSGKADANLERLWAALASVTWPMDLIVPASQATKVPSEVLSNSNVNLQTINPVGVEGWAWLERLAYTRGWGMPRPRNVLIPAIMAAVQMGYDEIYIAGADHSWLQTISVDDDNHVVSVQPHFYKEDDREVKRINTEYVNYPLHQILHSFYLAFSSYHRIQRYAQSRGLRIYNATPGSYIDAFPRRAPW